MGQPCGMVRHASFGCPADAPASEFLQAGGGCGKDAKNHGPTPVGQHDFKSELLEYLKLRSPHCFWIEEVTQVTKINPKTGFTYLEDLAAECTNLGYSVRATFLDHVSWIEVPRQRCFMIGIKDTAGGSTAANWCMQKLAAVMAKRTALGGPSLVWGLLALHDEQESVRIHREGQDTQQM